MKRFALIGWPVSGSGSPAMFGEVCDVPYDLVGTPSFEDAWEIFLRDYDAVNVTAPFKADAARKADCPSDAVRRIGAANICVKTSGGIAAFNSDYLAVRELISRLPQRPSKAIVLGHGGAGMAAAVAAQDEGLETVCLHHTELPTEAELLICALPRPCPGVTEIKARYVIEANYRRPNFPEADFGGRDWLEAQFRLGLKYFPL